MKPTTAIPLVLFLLTASLAGILLFCLVQSESPTGDAQPHPEFAEMSRGGEPAQAENLLFVAGCFGGLQIVLFSSAMGLAIRRDRSNLAPLVAGCLAYLAVFVAMIVAYANGVSGDSVVFGFPVPTAWMVFGMSGTPLIFVTLYIVKFRQWVYNEDDASKFAQLLAASTRQEELQSQDDG